MSAPVLTVTDLTVDVRKTSRRLVDGMSLDLHPGHVRALVGESGSGKSITARSILRLDDTMKVGGMIEFEGRNLATVPTRQMRAIRGRRIGIVFQDPLSSLNPSQTIGAQVTEPLRIRGVGKREARSRAVNILEEMDVPFAKSRMAAYPHQLSGGLRQRIAIAMALVAEPDVLIADEPTTALDVIVQKRVLELIRRVADERGISVLLITHDMGVVAEAADEVSVMFRGSLVEDGPVNEVFLNPLEPYTEGLMACVPRIDVDIERLPTISDRVLANTGRRKFSEGVRS